MALRESPFSSACVSGLHAASWALVFPSFWFLDRLLASCVSTTREREARRDQECYLHPLRVLLCALLFLLLFLLWAPLGLLGFLLWAPLQGARRPFRYHQGASERTLSLPISPDECHADDQLRGTNAVPAGRLSLCVATANLCLLPDSLARFNNLSDTQRRAEAIGGAITLGVSRPDIRIVVDSPTSSCGTLSASCSLLARASDAPPATPSSYGAMETQAPPPSAAAVSPSGEATPHPPQGSSAGVAPCNDPVTDSNQNTNQAEGGGAGSKQHSLRTRGRLPTDVPVEVSAMFPAGVDMLCLQEVFDKRAAERLRAALAPLYGHVLYDVGVYACHPTGCGRCCSSFKFFNSGLFFASRLPLLDASYHCFPNARGEDALAAKGLLCVKVLVSVQDQENQRMVGYFNCTHLHAPEGDGEVRFEQLNMVSRWIDEFQQTHTEEGEMVVFDVLCGDFNFDNCSPDDELEQKHSLFDQYRDPCRAGPGQEKPWVIGTLLEQPTLYDQDVSTPDSLQRTLEQEHLRMQYLCPPVARGGAPVTCPKPGAPWIGRRIDYVLYRENKNTHTDVEEFTYVTQLAGLTDHIPVGLRLSITLPSEEPDRHT